MSWPTLVILLLVISFVLSTAIANRSCALRAPHQLLHSVQIVLQAVPSLHQMLVVSNQEC